MDDDRVWLRHLQHGGYFYCPTGAVKDWTAPEMGWAVADAPPVENNPVVAERLAFEAEQRAAVAAASNETPAKSGRKPKE